MMRPGQAIVREVATAHGVGIRDVLSPWRAAHVVNVRREAAKRIKAELGYSLPRIGRILERDHTTVINLIRGRPRRPNKGS